MRSPLRTTLLAALAAASCATPPPRDPALLAAAVVRPTSGDAPLLAALEAGYSAAVVPIALDGKVIVSGEDGSRDLERDDLQPLARELGREGRRFLLVLAIRGDGEGTYTALESVLHRSREVLKRYEGGVVVEAPLRVVLAGDVPIERMARQRTRYAFASAGIAALESRYSAVLLPVVRVAWDDVTTWDGVGSIPEGDRLALHSLMARAHAQDRIVSIRGVPRGAWEEVLVAGADRIEVGDVEARETARFAHFLGRRRPR